MNDHCYVIPIEKSISPEEQETTSAVSLTIIGMGCPNCATRVHNGLLALKGVIQAEVNHLTASADVVFNPNLLTMPDLADAVANSGNDGRHRYQVVSVMRLMREGCSSPEIRGYVDAQYSAFGPSTDTPLPME